MTDRTRVRIGRSMVGVSAVAGIGGCIWLAVLGFSDLLWSEWIIHNAVVAVVSAAIVWIVLPTQPRNAEIWVFAWASVTTGLLCTTFAGGIQLAGLAVGESGLDLVPSEIPLSAALLFMQANWLWMGLFLVFTLGLLLLPDGRPPSPRWRWLFWATVVLLGSNAVALAWEVRPSGVFSYAETQDTSGGFRSVSSSIVTVGYPTIFAVVLACGAALVTRFRRSSGEVRQQLRLVTWAAAVAGAFMVAALMLDEIAGRLDIALCVGLTAMVVLLGSFGMSIAKYRLYDLDVVISRTVTFGALAIFIAGVYSLVVVGVGSLINQSEEPSLWLSIGATGLIAVLFEPIHSRVRTFANRLVYGERATPYSVLSQLSSQLADSEGDPLAGLASLAAAGTGASRSDVWVKIGERFVQSAAWPSTAQVDDAPGNIEHLTADLVVPVIDSDVTVGAIGIDKQRGELPTEADRRLLEEVAGNATLLLRNQRLNAELADRAEQLRASRQRLVAAHDAERHRLERDLHDGAQQQVVALKVKLGLAKAVAEREGASQVADMVSALSHDSRKWLMRCVS